MAKSRNFNQNLSGAAKLDALGLSVSGQLKIDWPGVEKMPRFLQRILNRGDKIDETAIFFFGLLSLLQGCNMAMADENKVTYIAEFRSTEAHCIYQVNGISVYSNTNRDETMQLSLSDRVGILLQEGKNSISIKGIDTPLDKSKSFCEFTLKAAFPNSQTQEVETKEVTSIRLTYDENNKFTVKESKIYPEPSLTEQTRLISLNDITYYTEEGMQNDVLALRTFEIRHPHKHHSWSYRSTPLENTSENFQKVWSKYEEFRTAFAKKDMGLS